MKILFKTLILIFLCGFGISSCVSLAKSVVNEGREDVLYLIAGFDDAAENTDVLFTVGFNKAENRVYVSQIPRDTYFNFGDSQNKINQIFASARAKGEDAFSAMEKTTDLLSDAFGVEFDGFIGITTESFRKIVDSLGGVDININSDMNVSLDDGEVLELKKGLNHIDGAAAEKFVRYRKGYTRGDLARVDAQKIFLNALFARLAQGITLPSLLSLASVLKDTSVSDINLAEVASFVFSNLSAEGEGHSSFVTLPGEAIQNESGLSYYVLNRKASEDIVRRYMFAEDAFDSEKRFLNKDNIGFVNIYEDDNIHPKEFSNENIADIRLS